MGSGTQFDDPSETVAGNTADASDGLSMSMLKTLTLRTIMPPSEFFWLVDSEGFSAFAVAGSVGSSVEAAQSSVAAERDSLEAVHFGAG